MSAFFEGRPSDSPYIEYVWRGHVEQDYSPVCPADVCWNLLFTRRNQHVTVSAEGATSQFVPKNQIAGMEFLVIKFTLGVFLPYLPAGEFVNSDVFLPEATSRTFWLNGFSWQFPDFDNAEAFVEQMVRRDVLHHDPVVEAALNDHAQAWSSRTVRRHFLQSTGLTPKIIEQIERAQKAAALLGQGVPILDAVYETGYADQPHMTRSLKRFIGATPAQIMREHEPT